MDKWKIINYIISNIDLLCTAVTALAFFIFNIILAIKNKDKKKLQEALLSLPEVICQVEAASKCFGDFESIHKKAMAEVILKEKFGKLYMKNSVLFDDAIEDILTTPQKKGVSVDVSKES